MTNALADRDQVIAVARTVTVGSIIRVEDVTPAQLPGDSGLAGLMWSEIDRVVGQTATTTLLPGQIVVAQAVGAPSLPGPGQAVVGVAVAAGLAPAAALGRGDRVAVIDAVTGGQGILGEVVSESTTSAETRTIDVVVDATDAAGVAVLSRAGQAAVVLLEDR
ncbi:SAF domain-containing protein [Pseudonocardia oroxyli]|uniref:SAF domain-containing protein n=1 Tax=Pseudonocardia oroxyli TaxID=366584 RepID=UPI0015A06B0E|nr:SAF domain-containing protein [Pseudonocardia oroxyli]